MGVTFNPIEIRPCSARHFRHNPIQITVLQSLEPVQKVLGLQKNIALKLAKNAREVEGGKGVGGHLEALPVHAAAPAQNDLFDAVAEIFVEESEARVEGADREHVRIFKVSQIPEK